TFYATAISHTSNLKRCCDLSLHGHRHVRLLLAAVLITIAAHVVSPWQANRCDDPAGGGQRGLDPADAAGRTVGLARVGVRRVARPQLSQSGSRYRRQPG